MSEALCIVLADDYPLMLFGLSSALTAADGLEVVAVAEDLPALLAVLERTRPDAVVLSARLGGESARASLAAVRERFATLPILVLGDDCDPAAASEALAAGANGYASKELGPVDLGAAIRLMVAGTVCLPAGLEVTARPAGSRIEGLGVREWAVVDGIGRGLANKRIAMELGLSEATVKYYVTRLYRKLGLSSRAEVVSFAHAQRGSRPRAARRTGSGTPAMSQDGAIVPAATACPS